MAQKILSRKGWREGGKNVKPAKKRPVRSLAGIASNLLSNNVHQPSCIGRLCPGEKEGYLKGPCSWTNHLGGRKTTKREARGARNDLKLQRTGGGGGGVVVTSSGTRVAR